MPGNDFTSALLAPDAALPANLKGHTPRRFAVYRNNVTVGLVRALEANFPAIRRLLGEAYFAGLAREFVQAHPPHSPLLFQYGDHFAAFLAGQGDLASYPYLADVARLEQQWRTAHHAADAPVLHASTFTGLGEQEMMALRLKPHPAAFLLSSHFAFASIFTANRGGSETVADPALPEWALLTRPFYDVHTRLIRASQFAFLAALFDGVPLGEAAENGFSASEDFDLADSLRLMLEAGVFQSTAL